MVYILLLWPSFLFLSCNKWWFHSYWTLFRVILCILHLQSNMKIFCQRHLGISGADPQYFTIYNSSHYFGHIFEDFLLEHSRTVQLQQSSKLFMQNNAFPIIRGLRAQENLVSILNLVKKCKRQYGVNIDILESPPPPLLWESDPRWDQRQPPGEPPRLRGTLRALAQSRLWPADHSA